MKNVSLILSLSVLTLLYGCSTPVSDKTSGKQVSKPVTPEIEVIEDSELSALDLLSAASNESNNQSTILLLQASAKFIYEQQLEQALHISIELSKLELTKGQYNYNQLNIAEALFELGYTDLAALELAKIETDSPVKRQLFLQANLNVQQDLLVDGIISFLDYHQQFPVQSIDEAAYLSSLFSKLTPWQKHALTKRSATDLNGWLEYSDIVANNGYKSANLNSSLKKWQKSNKQHPANLLTPDLIASVLEIENSLGYKNIAVLVPLSGREAPLGKTIQAGIIAVYQTHPERQLTFIDTNSDEMTDIVDQLHSIKPDFVIGPLLKQHVDSYLATNQQQTDITETELVNDEFIISQGVEESITEQSVVTDEDLQNFPLEESHSWFTLLLNLPEHAFLSKNQFALSMLPEDEASQAAFSLSQQGFKSALILSQNTAIGKRMANSFAEQWQKQTSSDASIIYYPTGNKMQQAVKQGLDVNLSDERIYLLRNRIKENVKAEARNRRDVDMIYMFATPDQARLLKPYIDVNISPFANAIPMYASSRSYNVDIDRNTRRDLNGLTFTEIPWLLPMKQVNPLMSADAKQIWPNRSSQLERIYAMGIDALQLVDKVKAMQLVPMLRHKGETGTLQMDANGIISRTLSWGKYRTSRIQNVEMQ
ncbi:penicillin-binding protein activator [Thalassotalea psychrophila]|uniref:Penicillin-binding protein activator n=1 Tax=Thalassotalea psychrophila TaxID=3065647 RepID=A0ABY9TWR6_9GAMM|nr:penicillin-binding protein activator [Colwelliaceae bacterium SQ149]